MECGVDIEGQGRRKAYSGRIHCTVNLKRPHKTRREILGVHLDGEISQGKPDLLAGVTEVPTAGSIGTNVGG